MALIEQQEQSARMQILFSRAKIFLEQAAMNMHEVTADKHKTAAIMREMAKHVEDHG